MSFGRALKMMMFMKNALNLSIVVTLLTPQVQNVPVLYQ